MNPTQPHPPAGAHVLVLGLTGAYTPLAAYVQPFARRGCAVTWVTTPAGVGPLTRAGCDVVAYDGDAPYDGDLARAGDDGPALLAALDQRHSSRPVRGCCC